MRAYLNKFCSSLSSAEPEMDTKCRVAGVAGSNPKFSKTVAVGGPACRTELSFLRPCQLIHKVTSLEVLCLPVFTLPVPPKPGMKESQASYLLSSRSSDTSH